ncbi:class I SAM-dependent methyltransferase, partial [Methylobacterium sp. WL8]|uniref:class I SAM-dependent methyltransferase n=1 Tax=Methylobacterium sp. WL8 TaxID=2603899 RepID=UPI0011C9A915
MDYSGERFHPDRVGITAYEHWQRYAFARQFVKEKSVLDVACGEGYGAAFLAESAIDVHAVDVSFEAIEWASKSYSRSNLRFCVSDISNLPFKDEKFDVVTCFETIEHILDHESAFSEIKRVLKKNGLLLISTPDKSLYSDGLGQSNIFHKLELTTDEFEEICKKFFKKNKLLGQRIYQTSVLSPLDSNVKSNINIHSLANGSISQSIANMVDPIYIIACCSDAALPLQIDQTSILYDNTYEAQSELEIIHSWAQSLRAELDHFKFGSSTNDGGDKGHTQDLSRGKDDFNQHKVITGINNLRRQLENMEKFDKDQRLLGMSVEIQGKLDLLQKSIAIIQRS